MRFFLPLVTLFCLFLCFSCEPPTALDKPLAESHPGIITTVKSARTATFTNSDLLYQWQVTWIDKDTYGWHTQSNDTCLGSLWLYFGQPDYSNGDIIEGTWTTTNLSCSDSHTGQQLLDASGSPYSVAFEEWNSIATMPQRYSFDKGTGAITLYRNVSLGTSLYKSMQLYLGTDKQAGFITGYSPYNDIHIQRATGGPSVP